MGRHTAHHFLITTTVLPSRIALAAKILTQKRLMLSAAVRAIGALLVVASVNLGIGWVGVDQFGIAMLAIAVGQVLAFPPTSMERLLIRLTSTAHTNQAAQILRLSSLYSGTIVVGTATLTFGALLTATASTAIFIAASGLVAITTNRLTLRQGINRAQGRLQWGQTPNEIVRPVSLILGFALSSYLGLPAAGSSATLIAYTATFVAVSFAPTSLPLNRGNSQPNQRLWKPMAAFILISLVGMLLERGLTMGLGILADPAEVTRYTIVLRVIQVAMFAQMFGIFFFSPQMAQLEAQGPSGAIRAMRRAGAIRLLGLASSIPTAIACLIRPDILAAVMGTDINLAQELQWTALAVLGRATAGATQAYLIMAGHEKVVARASILSVAFGLASLAAGREMTAVTVAATAAQYYVLWSIMMMLWCRIRLGRFV